MIDHTRDCVLPSDGKAEGLVKASELFALAAERDALRAENERLRAALEAFGQHFGPLEDNEWLHEDARRCFALARAALEEKQ